jgi:general secretion pathway protein D
MTRRVLAGCQYLLARSARVGLVLPLTLSVAIAGCATSAAMRAGRDADLVKDYDRAIVEYTKVLRADPDNREARKALELSKIRSSLDHFSRGRRFENAGRLDDALIELQIAAELNPGSGDIEQTLNSVRTQLRNKVASRDGKTELETLVERSRALMPAGQELPTDIKMPDSLTFRGSSRDVFTALGKIAGVNVVFDPLFRPQEVIIDLKNPSLEDALQAVSTASRNFYKVTAQRTVTVIPDTPAKRQEYEEEIVRPFFLSNADLKETMDLLRVVIDARRVAPVTATNTIMIKDTPERVAAAGKIIAAIDKARPEVVIDVELLEVDRTRLKEFGLQLASPGDPPTGINGTASINRDGLSLRDLSNLTQADILLTNLPNLYYRLLKQDTNTRTLANPQLRTSEGVPAQARFGERVPVPVTTFSPIATGGVNQQPITSFNYENIGVNIDITPRTHHDDQVSLALKVSVSNISGTGFGNLPTFGNREISTVIRLKDGETNLLAGLIRDEERRVLRGVAGLSDLPVVGRLFAQTQREIQETDIVLTLTPRVIRVLDLTEEDLRPFRVGDNTTAPLALPVPLPLPAPAEREAPPQAPAPPPAEPPDQLPGAKPILPPPPPK